MTLVQSNNVRLSGSPDLDSLVDDRGRTWRSVRKELTPRWAVVWMDIAVRLVLLGAGVYSFGWIDQLPLSLRVPLYGVASVWIGFWLHSLFPFYHEAAHLNLLPKPRWNDFVATLTFGVFLGIGMKRYRKTHWQHHLELGTERDSENDYFSPMSVGALLASLSGATFVLNVLRQRFAARGRGSAHAMNLPVSADRESILLFTIVLHLSIAASLAWVFSPMAACAWLVGLAAFYPFFSKVRNALEHRSLGASNSGPYDVHRYGPVNRMFGGGLFPRMFGSAGFNAHLLHHWDPSISYTRFAEMEAFLERSPIAPEVEAARSSYLRVFLEMIRK
jgi:fatty acid desaturase